VPPVPSPDRPIPDYRGRPSPPPTAGEVVLWVPRIVLSPLYFVTEYVLRKPLAAAIPAAERIDLPRKLYDFFTFGEDHKAGFVPVGYVEFGFIPSYGVYTWWDDAGFVGNHLHAHYEMWSDDWIAGNVTERIDISRRDFVQLRFSGFTRPDKVFYGIGPETQKSSQSRYTMKTLDGYAAYEWRYWRASRVQAMVGVRAVNTGDGSFRNDPSLTQEAATGAFAVPFGFGLEYTPQYNRLIASFDTREATNRPASGVVVEAAVEETNNLAGTTSGPWIRYGGNVGGYVDLNGYERILGLSLATQLVDPLTSGGQIPFPELVYLGGDHFMMGYYDGRLRDRSSIAATLSYAWPVGPYLDGHLEADVGNVFDEHLSGFAMRLLRLSMALGLSWVPSSPAAFQTSPLQILLGFGTATFAEGTSIDQWRISVGVPISF
jgi:hypothetical protein